MAFIVFEGGEGCGKTTQARLLQGKLLKLGIPATLVHEPGGTLLGGKLRRLVKQEEMSPETELFLFAAARAELVRQSIYPALNRGEVVIADRFTPSTLAYQGYGRGLDKNIIEAVNSLATQGLRPDLVILLDIPAREGLRRKGSTRDRFQEEELEFHSRVRDGYRKMAEADPERWLVVNAGLPRKEVTKIIWQRVSSLLPQPRG